MGFQVNIDDFSREPPKGYFKYITRKTCNDVSMFAGVLVCLACWHV